MRLIQELSNHIQRAVSRERLLETARALLAVPSRTGEAGAVSDRLAGLLSSNGFRVDRPLGGHPAAPAVVVRLAGKGAGRTIQFNGHLDTVHLPFVPPALSGNLLTGSGAADMKAGIAAAVEAVYALRDSGALPAGSVLLTAHDLHEAPWGWGQQLNRLIEEDVAGEGVLLPEPLRDILPTVGRGAATWKVVVRRAGLPVHEVMRPAREPDVLAAGAELVARLGRFRGELAERVDPLAGAESVFVGQFHGGEIYNQYPQECWLEGTRRWLPGGGRKEVEQEFRGILAKLGRDTGTEVNLEYRVIRDAYRLNEAHPLVTVFQSAFAAISGEALPVGPKPFVDDGNSFYGLRGLPAITHGPRAGGQHTVNEWVDVDDLVRVAHLYALTAVLFCAGDSLP
jgi:acetylornithine deacetylase/succinyl-diaminopimelate desuccinylase-like protein